LARSKEKIGAALGVVVVEGVDGEVAQGPGIGGEGDGLLPVDAGAVGVAGGVVHDAEVEMGEPVVAAIGVGAFFEEVLPLGLGHERAGGTQGILFEDVAVVEKGDPGGLIGGEGRIVEDHGWGSGGGFVGAVAAEIFEGAPAEASVEDFFGRAVGDGGGGAMEVFEGGGG